MQGHNHLTHEQIDLLAQIPSKVDLNSYSIERDGNINSIAPVYISDDTRQKLTTCITPMEKLKALGISEKKISESCNTCMLISDLYSEKIVTAILKQMTQKIELEKEQFNTIPTKRKFVEINNISPEMALANISRFNTSQVDAITLGLLPDQMHGHDWRSDQHGLCDNGAKTVGFLRNEIGNGIDPVIAIEKIRGLRLYQIDAVELGLNKEQLAGHNWGEINGPKTIEFLRKEIKNGVAPIVAMEKIRGLKDYEIDAVGLGLTREQLAGHQWNTISGRFSSGAGYETISYLRDRPRNVAVSDAMDAIRGLSGEAIRNITEKRKPQYYMTGAIIWMMNTKVPAFPQSAAKIISQYLIEPRATIEENPELLPDGTYGYTINHIITPEKKVIANEKNVALTCKSALSSAELTGYTAGRTKTQQLQNERAARAANSSSAKSIGAA